MGEINMNSMNTGAYRLTLPYLVRQQQKTLTGFQENDPSLCRLVGISEAAPTGMGSPWHDQNNQPIF
jgi:hypothetical protein